MPPTRRSVAVLVGVFCAGTVSGHLFTDRSPSRPEEVVTAPTPQPSVTPTATPSPEAVQHLPDSCLSALDTLSETENYSAIVSRTTGNHLSNMSEAGTAMVEKDQQQLNKIIQQEIHLKDRTDAAAVQLESLQLLLNRQLSECRADSEDGS